MKNHTLYIDIIVEDYGNINPVLNIMSFLLIYIFLNNSGVKLIKINHINTNSNLLFDGYSTLTILNLYSYSLVKQQLT